MKALRQVLIALLVRVLWCFALLVALGVGPIGFWRLFSGWMAIEMIAWDGLPRFWTRKVLR